MLPGRVFGKRVPKISQNSGAHSTDGTMVAARNAKIRPRVEADQRKRAAQLRARRFSQRLVSSGPVLLVLLGPTPVRLLLLRLPLSPPLIVRRLLRLRRSLPAGLVSPRLGAF